MRISNCLHPKLIVNPYTKEKQFVPCGKCESCLNIKSYSWQQRIVQESRKHRYSVFFTLTYDNDCMPTLVKHGDYLVDVARQVRTVYKGNVIEKTEYSGNYIEKNQLDLSKPEDQLYFDMYNSFGYPLVSDVQKFIKRLRSNIHEFYKKVVSEFSCTETEKESDFKIRYCIVSEFGNYSFRPHYHGLLWFESRTLAKEITNLICKSWLLCSRNKIDVQFSNAGTAQYVAKYINGSMSLPSVYRHPTTRPFLLCSRRPFIAGCLYTPEKVREILDNSIVEISYYDVKKQKNIITRHFCSFENRFCPKCPSFGKLSDADRTLLYSISRRANFKDVMAFLDYCRCNNLSDYSVKLAYSIFYSYYCSNEDFVKDYDLKFDSFFSRLYRLSCMVFNNAVILGYHPEDYVKKIISYWDAVDKYNLSSQYKFQQDYAKNHDPNDLTLMYPLSVLDFDSLICDTFDYIQMSSVQKKIHTDMVNNKKRKSFLRALPLSNKNKRVYYGS